MLVPVALPVPGAPEPVYGFTAAEPLVFGAGEGEFNVPSLPVVVPVPVPAPPVDCANAATGPTAAAPAKTPVLTHRHTVRLMTAAFSPLVETQRRYGPGAQAGTPSSQHARSLPVLSEQGGPGN